LPVVRVLGEGGVVALHPFDELVRSRTVGLRRRVRRLDRLLVDDVQRLEQVEREWLWLVRLQDDRVLVRCFDSLKPLALQGELADADLRVADPLECVLDVIAGELSP
jgi:hypothetical protein